MRGHPIPQSQVTLFVKDLDQVLTSITRNSDARHLDSGIPVLELSQPSENRICRKSKLACFGVHFKVCRAMLLFPGGQLETSG